MFFSKEQIEQSIKRLDGLNPFFGITFLGKVQFGRMALERLNSQSVSP